MSLPLTLVLQGLVASGLSFVAITESAPWIGLAPLFLATGLAPWLRRFADRPAWRLMWNLLALAMLVNLLIGLGRGSEGLLQNGLLMSALCQVHLLCTLRRGQEPDLLLFNSYLIAAVTSVLSLDFAYFLIAAAYVPLLITTLRLLSAQVENASLRPARLAPVFVESGVLASGLLLMAMVLFVFLPRDFERSGVLDSSLKNGSVVRIGFKDHFSMGVSGRRDNRAREVFQLERLRGEAHEIPELWRGATVTHLVDGEWRRPATAPGYDPLPWIASGNEVLPSELRRARVGGGPVLRYRRKNLGRGRIFLPANASRCSLRSSSSLAPIGDGGLKLPEDVRHLQALEYDVEVARRPENPVRPRQVPDYLTDVPRGIPVELKARAARIGALFDPSQQRAELVESCARDVRDRHAYVLPGEPGAARSLREFVDGRGGHCEVFAAVLLIMLRELKIPSRIALGYRVDVSREVSDIIPVMSSDAHAWVEYLSLGEGWVSVDATPAASRTTRGAEGGFFAGAFVWLREAWEAVTNLDADTRDGLLRRIKAGLRNGLLGLAGHPFRSIALVGLLVFVLKLRRGRRRGDTVATRRYVRILEKHGIRRRPEETPRALLARLQEEGVSEKVRMAVQRVTLEHEAARYGVPTS